MDSMRTSGARWAWVLAASFLLGTIGLVLVWQNITVPGYGIPEGTPLPDALFKDFEFMRGAFPQEIAYALLFSLGFLAVAMLGPILRDVFGRRDPRVTRMTVLFLVAGTIGMVSQLIYLAGKDVAIVPYYCDCDYLAPQLISRGAVLDAVVGIQAWMTDAFSVLFAIGLLAAAGVAGTRGWGRGFVRASVGVAALGLAAAAWSRVAVPLLVNADVHIDYYGIRMLILAVVAGVAVPIWAVITARELSREPIAAAA